MQPSRFLTLFTILVIPVLLACDLVPRDERKVAPYSGVRWTQGGTPEVELDGRWWGLAAIDETPAQKIVTFAKQEYDSRWQKRFEEDLPMVLARMGARAGETVKLTLRDLESGAVVTREDVAMTEENRRRIREAAGARGGGELTVLGSVFGGLGSGQERHAKLAPFTAVRWKEATPLVLVDGRWIELASLDGVPIAEIIAFIQREEGDRWQKRFGEDLVEMLARMGKPAGSTVDLAGVDAETREPVTLRGVQMTEANRRAVWEANNRRSDAPAGPVRRVEREHSDQIKLPYQRLRRALVTDPKRTSGSLTRAEAEQDLDELEWYVQHHYAYRDRVKVDYRNVFDAVRVELPDVISRNDFAILVTKLLGLFGDGHTRVEGETSHFPPGYLPVLLAETPAGIVAFREDRTEFFEQRRWFLAQIDNVKIDRWISAAAHLHPAGSPQFVRRTALRNLRYVNLIRAEMGLEQKPMVELFLTNEGSRATILYEAPLAESKPTYGQWPRTDHRRIDDRWGYLRVPSMTGNPEAIAKLHGAMRALAETEGLVIDVRGNGGGTRDILRALFGYFMRPDDDPHVANIAAYRLHEGDDPHAPEGHLSNRYLWPAASARWNDAERAAIEAAAKEFRPGWQPPEGDFSDWHYMVLSRDPEVHAFTYQQPVVVLQDGGCFSATDIFLGAFHGWRDVTFVGTPSGGGSGRSRGHRLANSGLSVRLSSMASFRPSGELYDGFGIQPDVVSEPTPQDLLGIGDTVLDRAVEVLKGR